MFDQLLGLKLQEQHKRELRNETTTCAKRWEQQTYEVDEQVGLVAWRTIRLSVNRSIDRSMFAGAQSVCLSIDLSIGLCSLD